MKHQTKNKRDIICETYYLFSLGHLFSFPTHGASLFSPRSSFSTSLFAFSAAKTFSSPLGSTPTTQVLSGPSMVSLSTRPSPVSAVSVGSVLLISRLSSDLSIVRMRPVQFSLFLVPFLPQLFLVRTVVDALLFLGTLRAAPTLRCFPPFPVLVRIIVPKVGE